MNTHDIDVGLYVVGFQAILCVLGWLGLSHWANRMEHSDPVRWLHLKSAREVKAIIGKHVRK